MENSREQTVTALVENKSGVLARIVSLFARRGFNIYSLNVAPTDDDRFSRITFVYDTRSAPVEQVISQVGKLIEVLSVEAIKRDESVKRELLMASITATAESRAQVVELINLFEGKVIDVGHDGVTAMLAGRPDKLNQFEELIRPYGILEMQRSGRIALKSLASRNVEVAQPRSA